MHHHISCFRNDNMMDAFQCLCKMNSFMRVVSLRKIQHSVSWSSHFVRDIIMHYLLAVLGQRPFLSLLRVHSNHLLRMGNSCFRWWEQLFCTHEKHVWSTRNANSAFHQNIFWEQDKGPLGMGHGMACHGIGKRRKGSTSTSTQMCLPSIFIAV